MLAECILLWVVAAFVPHVIDVSGATVKLEIWDTAGQERYASLAPLYYHNAHAAIVVYDISSSKSFKKAQFWVEKLRREATPSMVIALAGNKLDVIDDPSLPFVREVETEDVRTYAEANNLLFFETSAKTGMQVTELFHGCSCEDCGYECRGGGADGDLAV